MAVVLVPVVARQGVEAVFVVGVLAGILLLAATFARLGRYLAYVPWPVVEGFTFGIGVIIFLQQVPDALGVAKPAGENTAAVAAEAAVDAFSNGQLAAVGLALMVVALMVALPRLHPSLPASLMAVAAATIEPVFLSARDALAVVAVFSWSVGVFLYAAAGIFVSLRMMLYELRPQDLNPPYWVAMGASAITVLAGARIVEMEDAPMVDATRGLVGGLSVVFWAFATWLFPALVAAGWWRHRTHRVPLRYEATLWSIVFPLGMYAVAGIYLGQANSLPLVGAIGGAELWVAFAAWALSLVAMVWHVVRTVLLPVPDDDGASQVGGPAHG